MSTQKSAGTERIPTPRLPIHMTFFAGREEAVGQRRTPTWAQVAARLREPGVRGNSHKPSAGQWSMCTFRANRRGSETLDQVYGLVLEYDGNPDLTLRDLRGAWGRWCYLAHTTLHHNRPDLATRRPEFPRWRLLIPLSKPVSREDYEKIARWARLRGGPAGLLDTVLEPGRVYNQPIRTEGYCHDANHMGVPLDPGYVLADLITLEEAEARDRARDALESTMPPLSSTFGLDDLDFDRRRTMVSIGSLPGWPGSPPSGHGLGRHLDIQLGGGICPGYVVSLGSRGVGSATTALLHQLIDGLAMRSIQLAEGEETSPLLKGPLTPVVLLSEEGPAALTWRSLARWTGADQRVFRAGSSSTSLLGLKRGQVERAFSQARAAMESRLGRSRELIRVVSDLPAKGRDMVEPLVERVELWRRDLVERYHRETWPVVVCDPVELWQDHAKPGIQGTNELVEALVHAARARGWVLFLTSGIGGSEERGGYSALSRLPDACLRLQTPDKPGETGPGLRELELAVLHNRWGREEPPFPRFRYTSRSGRFEPVGIEEVAMRWDDEGDASDHTVLRQAPPRDTRPLARGDSRRPMQQTGPAAAQREHELSPQQRVPPPRRPAPRPRPAPEYHDTQERTVPKIERRPKKSE